MRGKITARRDQKGFGFIRDDRGQGEPRQLKRFFHKTDCTTSFDALAVGDDVEFEGLDDAGGKGPRALKVRLVE